MIAQMTIAEVAVTGVLMIEDEETIETEVAQEMTKAAIVETEVTTVAKTKTTLEMTGNVENVAILIFPLEQNVIAAGHRRDVAAEVHQNSGLVTIEELAIETKIHNPVQEIGNVASARK